mmetsp:Transcript_16720/g.41370  ORF Transcript_16720/g.41370 Transcript_16720/m.41370 type:complete len:363 (+) Transcript_16720:7-1095(+)
MALDDGSINPLDGRRVGQKRGHGREVPLQPVVDHEGTRLRVHAGHELDVLQVALLGEVVPVVDLHVTPLLQHEHRGRLRVVLVHRRHVHVVDEEEALLVRRRPVRAARALVQGAHEDRLERGRGRVAVVADGGAHHVVATHFDLGAEVLHDRGLPGTRNAHEQHRLVPRDVQVHHVLVLLNVHARNHDVLVHHLDTRQRLARLHKVLPVDPLLAGSVEPVVLRVSRFRGLDFCDSLDVARPGLAAVGHFVVRDGAPDGPIHGVAEVRLVHQLLILHADHPQCLHVLLRVVGQQRVDDGRNRLHEAHVQNRAREVEHVADAVDVRTEVVVAEEQVEGRLRDLVQALAPRLHDGLPPHVGLVDE